MDPFTQKLLERTQARKEQLAKKREELAACRSMRNAQAEPSPVKPRRPLSEDNTDTKDQTTDGTPKRRINSDSDVPKTPKEHTTPKTTITPKGPTTPKMQHLGSTTPSSTVKVRSGVEIDPSSPSIQARRERLILMQQKDQENNLTPKKHWKKALDINSNEDSSPTVAARSAIFENQTQDKESKLSAPKPSVTTPGKISAARNVFEKNSAASETTSVKTDSAAPPKPPRSGEAEKTLTREKSSSKRKAPAPPNGASNEHKAVEIVDVPVPKPRSEKNDYDSSIVSVKYTDGLKPAKREKIGELVRANIKEDGEPTPKPRKRRSVENAADGSEKEDAEVNGKEMKDEREKRQERKKARMENQKREGIIAVTAQAIEVLEGKDEKVVAVEVNSVRNPRNAQRSKAKVTVVSSDTEEMTSRTQQKDALPRKEAVVERDPKQEKVCGAARGGMVAEEPKKLVTTSTSKPKTAKKTKEGNSGFRSVAPPRPPPPESISRFGSQSTLNPGLDDKVNLNDSVNLNDVNIHEMTFTFDFSNFDKIQEDRETKFQKSFDEQQRQLEKEKRETSSSQSSDDSDVSSYVYEPKTKLDIEETNMGVYKSGYNTESGDKYATKMYKKTKPCVPERPKPTDKVIKELLDEAAAQQNIILQTSQALNVCDSNNDIFKGSPEEVEAERVLLLASERKQACLNEHHRVKTKAKENTKDRNVDSSNACTSTLSISGIRLSLKQEFMDVIRVGIRHDLGVFHFVCHVQNGPLEINSTKSLSINDCNDGNYLIFPDKFVMKNVNPDFSVVVRVFGMHVQKYVPSTVSASQKPKFFQSPKSAKAKRRGMDGASPDPMPVFRNSNFKLIGSTPVTLKQIGSKKWTLDGVAEGCPLKESIQMKTSCTPQYTSHVKGFLTILEDVGGFSAWQRRWCVLEGGLLSYWRYPGDETTQPPLDTLDIGQCSRDHITTVPRDLCARPNTIEVNLNKNKEEVRFLLACDTKEDRITWVNCLNEALCDMKAWTKLNKRPLYPELGQEDDTKGSQRK